MSFIDYYKILGIAKDTPQQDLRKAYTKRAKQFHPDLHPDDPKAKAKFQALNEAYAVLSDPAKRKQYDQYGEHWQQADAYQQQASNGSTYGGNPFGGDFDFNQFGSSAGFSSFFRDLFGEAAGAGMHQGHRTAANADRYNAQATVTIDLYTALLGGDILLQTQSGRLRLKVKPCTANGAKIRLSGKGYQKPDGTYGNLIITYQVQLPTSLTEKQQELLRQMQREQQP